MLDSLSMLLKEKTSIPFVEYMQKVLYDPEEGYYTCARTKFGAAGDFVTAPEISPLFGQTLARQCEQVLQRIPQAEIMEFGAGSGRLCIDILQELERRNALPERYYILDVSAGLKKLQQENFQREIPHLLNRIQWLTRWPDTVRGIILANEVLDAMPVHRFLVTAEGLRESWITLGDDQLQEEYRDQVDPALENYIRQYLPDLPVSYQSEVNLLAGPWISALANALYEGVIFLIDYGFPRHEYYHSDRRQGTLMCHYRHHSHPDPLRYPGEQDISTHVDFTYIAEAASEAGLHVAGFTNQASFLLANGLLSLLDTNASPVLDIQQKQAVKQLTHPHEMGELFKVMALSKGFAYPLQGFLLSDKRASL